MNKTKGYLQRVLLYTVLFLLTIAGFNYYIDPYQLFDVTGQNGSFPIKPEVGKHARMIKAHKVRLLRPDAIILGSSRSEVGLDPNHPSLTDNTNSSFNLSLHSANIYEIYKYLQHAHSIHPVKKAVLGLDFFMFNANKESEKDFDQHRLEPSSYIPIGWYRDIFKALFTYDALLASWNTVVSQNDKSITQYNSGGFPDDNSRIDKIRKKGGHRQAAINNERYSLSESDGFAFFTLFKEQSSQSLTAFQSLSQLLIFSHSENIDLRLFISPIHARKLVVIHKTKLWEEFENWKIMLIENIEHNAPSYSLWDFTGFNEITMEPFPPLSDAKSHMKWYWESSHYKKETGNLILDTIFGLQQPDRYYPKDFGMLISSENIDQHLSNIRSGLPIFNASYLSDISEISTTVANTRTSREILFRRYPNITPAREF